MSTSCIDTFPLRSLWIFEEVFIWQCHRLLEEVDQLYFSHGNEAVSSDCGAMMFQVMGVYQGDRRMDVMWTSRW